MGYTNLLRTTYVTLAEKYSNPDRLFPIRNPQWWALNATSGIVSIHATAILIGFDLVTDAIVSTNRIRTYGAVLAAAGLASWWVLKKYILQERNLSAVRAKLRAETGGDAGMRRMAVGLLQFTSFVVFIVLLYSTG